MVEGRGDAFNSFAAYRLVQEAVLPRGGQEARSARDSSFVENLGTYNPRSKPAKVDINKERVEHWLKQGARPSDSVRTLLAKHLSRDLSPQPAPVVE